MSQRKVHGFPCTLCYVEHLTDKIIFLPTDGFFCRQSSEKY